ncbi:hypothetical protein EB796_003621 [Bugula neritina]|uniref:Uncharacterized protein n=1 Tax=Bugula neritina TaxID=10212 RepID=A0A7J7KIK6_BUGNE|nr:hypothetical protein EB796_003621 [Bugula neritina]
MASRRTMGPSCRRRAVPQVTRTRSHSSDRQYRLRRDSSPLTRTSLAPGSTYSTQSAHSTISPVTRDELSSEQRTVLQKRQLEVDVRNLLSWLGEAEELSLRWAERVPGDLNSLGKLCAQYKDFYTRLQQQRSRVLSINIIASMDDSAGSELDSLNSRWEKIQEMMVRHRTRLQPRLVACKELERQIKKLSDSVTAIQLEVISEVSDVKSVESHLRRHYKAIKSHLSNLSPILAEYQPAEQLMDYLLIAEDKCKTLLKIED